MIGLVLLVLGYSSTAYVSSRSLGSLLCYSSGIPCSSTALSRRVLDRRCAAAVSPPPLYPRGLREHTRRSYSSADRLLPQHEAGRGRHAAPAAAGRAALAERARGGRRRTAGAGQRAVRSALRRGRHPVREPPGRPRHRRRVRAVRD